MDITKLRENIISKTIKYRDGEINLEIIPDALTNKDATDESFTTAKYVSKALKSWSLTMDGEALPITEESLDEIIPSALLTQIFDTILEIRDAGMGKLKVVGK